jgi:hypothetical protein
MRRRCSVSFFSYGFQVLKLAQVTDERIDLVRGRLDDGGPLDAEGVGASGGEDEDAARPAMR